MSDFGRPGSMFGRSVQITSISGQPIQTTPLATSTTYINVSSTVPAQTMSASEKPLRPPFLPAAKTISALGQPAFKLPLAANSIEPV
ncbi:hypothetical protein NM688_g2230 [Phlebia brevispora]|uniref:Uncharacterized protein n=1 Tax=Phlebia brevispora TaxID=194682 RepID=A0ACC1T937_9APHY|nr:hypothetical protein NM688_g2230 [Phlebia brevispora]